MTKTLYDVAVELGFKLYCKDCKHVAFEERIFGNARKPGSTDYKPGSYVCNKYTDLITGEPNWATHARYDERQCGRKGRGFEHPDIQS